ncbi:retrovirus-related pol polyprotein from transposon TNT 1-94 [Tanacetum coccineum]
MSSQTNHHPPAESALRRHDPEQVRRIRTCRKIWLLLPKYFKKLYKTYKQQTENFLKHQKTRMWILLQGKAVGGPVVQTSSGIQCFNCKEFGHYGYGIAGKPKGFMTPLFTGKIVAVVNMLRRKVVQLQPEQSDWASRHGMKDIDEQELEAHYSYMAKIQEVPNADSGTDAEPLEQDDQNDVECDDERVALANLIANLKLDVDENKKIQKQLKKANATLTQELTECKSILVETSRTLGEYNSIRDSCLVALQNKQMSLMVHAFNDRTVDYDKLEHKLNEALGLLAQKEIDIKEDEITELQCLYLHKVMECDCLAQKLSEQTEFVSKEIYTELLQSFGKLEKHSISLEIALQDCQEQLKNDTVCKEKASNVFRKEREQYFEIQDLKAQMQEIEQTDLYTISLQETTSSAPICLMAKASPTQAWLWHRRLSHLNFDYINLLSKKDVVIGLPKLKYVKDQLCSSCEVSKAKQSYSVKDCSKFKRTVKLASYGLMWSNAGC